MATCDPRYCTFGNFDFAWTLAENDRLRADIAWKDMIIKAADTEMGRLREALRVRYGATDAEIHAVLHPYDDGPST